MSERRLSRRSILRLAGIAAASLGTGAWKSRDAEGGGPAAVEAGSVSCVLIPEMTEGPFYIAREKVRRNITDGHPGTPLVLGLTVVDASTCKPITGAAVDIWHADAAGNYSGFGRAAAAVAARSCAGSSARMRTVSRPSAPSIPGGTRAAPSTSM
jgi:protocatechuate 3,4-dioxygenase beta subunit